MDTNKLKNIQLNLLKEFIDVCSKLNLRYFAIGGTALGAVRHNGFIPWDDDIDVALPRVDYNIFVKEGIKLIRKDYFLQTYVSDEEYVNNFAKLRDNNTTCIEMSSSHLKINHGVYIDIFPLDGMSENKIIRIFNFIQIKLLYKKLKLPLRNNSTINYTIRKYTLNGIILLRFFSLRIRKLHILLDKKCEKYAFGKSKYVINFLGAWGLREIMLKDVFGDGVIKKFEDTEIIIPKNYHLYLSTLYGDYMTFPPKEEQVSHHHIVKFDLDNSYIHYLK